MHEKTLLYSALVATAIAAAAGVYHVKTTQPTTSEVAITRVDIIDAPNTISQAETPIRLTASDGTGLKLVSMRAEASVEDPLALTELHLVFENPEDRVLEGNFRMTLPQGASLSRFAMKVGNAWQEGEVVEKQAARQAYEDFLHRKQDPALLEQSGGNEFAARVFPIPARGTKEIIISYSEVLEAGSAYTLPLRGLPKLGNLDVNLHATGGRSDATFSVHQQNFTPGQDFVVEGAKLPRSAGLKNGDLAIARVVPFTSSRPDPIGSAVLLVDTSASRGLGLAEQVKLIEKVLAKVPPDTQIQVGAFDQEVVSIYEGKASGFGPKESQAILSRGALGASDIEGALAWAGEQAKRTKAKRVVMIGDGVATEGETDGQKIKDKVQALRDSGVERMDAIAVGGIRDDAFLRSVVRGVLDKDGVVLDGKLGGEAVARRLAEATTSGIPVKVEGAAWSWPEKLDGLQAGDEVIVYAQMNGNGPVKITVGTQTFAPDLRTIDRPLVERAWAGARIQSLIDAPTESAEITKKKIIDLSTRHRVLSPYTALLVLETEWDYRRFNIDRTANVDILSVQDGRVAVLHEPRDREAQERNKLAEVQKNEAAKGGADNNSVTRPSESKAVAAPSPQPMQAAATPTATTMATSTPPMQGPRGGLDTDGEQDQQNMRDLLGRAAGGEAAPGASAGRSMGGLELGGLGQGGGGTGDGFGSGTGRLQQQEQGHAGSAPTPPPPPQGQATAPTRPAARRPRAPSDPSDALTDEPAPSAPRSRAHSAPPIVTTPTRDPAPVVATGTVRPGTIVVDHGISEGEVQRVLRGANTQLRECYTRELATSPTTRGRVAVRVVIDPLGEVKGTEIVDSPTASLGSCVTRTVKAMRFAAPGGSDGKFEASFEFVRTGGGDEIAENRNGNVPRALPYEGRFKTVMDDIARGDKNEAVTEAKKWQGEQPGDVMALVALGEASEANGDVKTAARAYGSILELFSFRADSRRFAGERLERLNDPMATKLAIDTFRKAVEQRPDHPASHRLYAYTLLKHGEFEKAFTAIEKGAARRYPSGRFAGVDRILKEDMGLVASAWAKAQPARRGEIMAKLKADGGTAETGASLRFVLVWETDANDVDFHIYDGKGGHAYYGNRNLPSGGELYADVTTGYGPECFTIPGGARSFPYTLQAHYYSRGPMGYGMGKLEIIDSDGKGGLSFEERPFVIQADRAFVDLGTVGGKPKNTIALK